MMVSPTEHRPSPSAVASAFDRTFSIVHDKEGII